MKEATLVFALAFAPITSHGAIRPFDGDWATTVSCANAKDALGYSFDVPSKVKGGVFHGERLSPGKPGWLMIDGQVADDGRAELYAKGLVGGEAYAVNQRPRGTDYGYHIDARFERDRGEGHRIEGRPCEVTFERR